MLVSVSTINKLNIRMINMPDELLETFKNNGFATFNKHLNNWEIKAPTDHAYKLICAKYEIGGVK